IAAGLEFHYSPDTRYIVADNGGIPSVAWYDRSTDAQWLVAFSDDPTGQELWREFVSWDPDSGSFVYREATRPGGEPGPPTAWTYWRADPTDHSRTSVA